MHIQHTPAQIRQNHHHIPPLGTKVVRIHGAWQRAGEGEREESWKKDSVLTELLPFFLSEQVRHLFVL